MSPRWRKVYADLQESPARSILVILAITVGVAAISTAFGAQAILSREVEASFQSSHPASAVFWLDHVDTALLDRVRLRPGVKEAEARRLVRARVEVSPGQWLPLRLFGVRDFHDLRVASFRGMGGAQAPPNGELLVERSSLSVLHAGQGDDLRVRVPGGKVTSMHIAGIVHDAGQAPGWQDQIGYAYVSSSTLAGLGLGESLDELQISLAGRHQRQRASQVASDLAQWLQQAGRMVEHVEISLGKHPHADHMFALVALLQVFGVLALLLSAILVANVMTAVLARQVRQVGILKAVGAHIRQLVVMYLTYVFVLAASGTLLGIPAGVFLARAFARSVSPLLNVEIESWAVPTSSIALEFAVGLCIPLLVTAIPIWRAIRRMSAREALQDVGVSHSPSRGYLTRALSRHSFVDRRVLLAFANTFRRPVRLWLTLGALATGGALLMAAGNVYSGLVIALDRALAARGDDIDVRLLRPASARSLTEQALKVPGVIRAEPWGVALVSIELPSSAAETKSVAASTERFTLLAPPPAGSQMFRLPLASGRWADPAEGDAVVVNTQLLAREPTLMRGAHLALRAGSRRTVVQVVGIVNELGEPALYTNSRTFHVTTGAPAEMASGLRVVTAPGTQSVVAASLEESLVNAGSFPVFVMTREALRRALADHFVIVLLLLSSAALSAVVVGGLSLATSMSLNVLERSRESGVIRALGATRADVLQIIGLEAAALTLISVIAGVKLSLPLTFTLGWILSKVGLHAPVPFALSPWALWGWIGTAALVSGVACLVPTRAALRQSVCEAIAHE